MRTIHRSYSTVELIAVSLTGIAAFVAVGAVVSNLGGLARYARIKAIARDSKPSRKLPS